MDSDADTIEGDETGLNESFSSSTIITFNDRSNKNEISSRYEPNNNSSNLKAVKRVEEMTPEELMQANPALRQLMGKLLDK